MATTTVAAGRIRNKSNEGLRMPARLGLEQGRAAQHRSAGGARERRLPDIARRLAGKLQLQGYGLAVMVNILGSCLSGATLITDPMHTKKPQGNDIGHCFIAIDPDLFREPGEFEADVAGSATTCGRPGRSTRRSRSWWRATRNGTTPSSGWRKESRSAPDCCSRSARSLRPALRPGSSTDRAGPARRSGL